MSSEHGHDLDWPEFGRVLRAAGVPVPAGELTEAGFVDWLAGVVRVLERMAGALGTAVKLGGALEIEPDQIDLLGRWVRVAISLEEHLRCAAPKVQDLADRLGFLTSTVTAGVLVTRPA
ncbi:hypothetical protein Lfu02_77840 [Longispora fulva]|uniref:Uncharacterized protein n=1 Tax=Longispora fulva TaxID=619741 RepID=A0A8J7GSI2_9ACTN|nr:hypothetical protein [Longispora fulva]MBG6136231.1 hypothetical protein [Longispora fulva]GIG63412.1 hypothetical protein Lfu02_77840 [Longispora fulva]